MPPLVSLAELKGYLGITGTQDDSLIASVASNASIMVERDTGRVFAVSSNVTRRYSSNGQASLVIHDRPFVDGSRVVTLSGITRTEGTDVWFLTDRRNGDITVTIQLRYFDTTGAWYKNDPDWFSKNLDRYPFAYGAPNDLVIVGVEGHPVLPLDVFEWTRKLAALLYWQAKSGASGFVQTPTGDELDLTDQRPPGYARFVNDWKIHTAVAST